MNQAWPISLIVLAGFAMYADAQPIVVVSCVILSFIGLVMILAVEHASYVSDEKKEE